MAGPKALQFDGRQSVSPHHLLGVDDVFKVVKNFRNSESFMGFQEDAQVDTLHVKRVRNAL